MIQLVGPPNNSSCATGYWLSTPFQRPICGYDQALRYSPVQTVKAHVFKSLPLVTNWTILNTVILLDITGLLGFPSGLTKLIAQMNLNVLNMLARGFKSTWGTRLWYVKGVYVCMHAWASASPLFEVFRAVIWVLLTAVVAWHRVNDCFNASTLNSSFTKMTCRFHTLRMIVFEG